MAQDALGGTHAGEGGATPRPRTTYLQRALAIRLKAASPDLTLAAIAEQVGCSERTVARILEYHEVDVKASTQAVMSTAILERLDDWAKASRIAAKKGYHQPAKDFIEAAGGITAKPTGPPITVNPTVVLNMPFPLGAVAQPEPPEPPAPLVIDARTSRRLGVITSDEPPALAAQAVPVLPPKDAA